MIKLPLSVCEHTAEPYGIEYDIGIVNLGVPNDDRVYVMSDVAALQTTAHLYLRFVPMKHTIKADDRYTIKFGQIDNLRLVGGTIRGTFKPHQDCRVMFANFIENMNGNLIVGLIGEIESYKHGNMIYADIKRVIGGQVLMEDGRAFGDTTCPIFVLDTMVRERSCNPLPISEANIRKEYDANFISILTDCGYSLTDRTVGDMAIFKKLYEEALGHYRVNPMLIGGKSEKPTGNQIKPVNAIYIKNQFIKKLRTPKYAHITPSAY